MVLVDCFPVPLMEDVLESLQAASWYTVMDLENGYFHVPVQEESKSLTAFVTREGLYEFNKTPFGLKNSPAAYKIWSVCVPKPYQLWNYAAIHG